MKEYKVKIGDKDVTVQVERIFEPRDFWIGVYVGEMKFTGDNNILKRSIYILPLPMLGWEIEFVWKQW